MTRSTSQSAENSDPLAVFHPVTAAWFRAVFEEPTAPQRMGWPAIARGENTLILAKDYLGTRSLFYRVNGNQVAWSTVLKPLLSLFGGPPKLCESYIAGWMTFFPEDHLTPYQEIHSVPPSSFVRIQPDKVTTHRYSSVENAKPIRYSTDRQYEEHFLSVFSEAVRRRIDSPKPILA